MIARMCASVNVLSSAVPRCPLVPKATRSTRVARIGTVRVIGLLERRHIDQDARRGQLTRQGMNRHQNSLVCR